MAQAPARVGGAPAPASDWTVTTADTVERVVGTIRDKTTVPLTTVARAIVYGQIAAVMGLTALVLLVILVVRIIANYIGGPVGGHARAVWVTEGFFGLVFVFSGAILLRVASAKRSPQ